MNEPGGVSRRGLFGYTGAALASGALAGGFAARKFEDDPLPASSAAVSPFGAHQPGVSRTLPRAVSLLAFTWQGPRTKSRLEALLKQWSTDITALTQGEPAGGDTAPALALASGLTLTLGLGAALFTDELQSLRPDGVADVPAMRHDQLQRRWSGGDLLVHVAADDATTVAHAVRQLTRSAADMAAPLWEQQGFWNAVKPDGSAFTGRNLFGQLDGSGNPQPDSELFDKTVWITDGPWSGGTTLVVRRIRMDLDSYEALNPTRQSDVIGRDVASGGPLSGGKESADVDLGARGDDHALLIAGDAHVRRAHPSVNADRRIFRAGANYSIPGVNGTENGLIFHSYQRDVAEQFTPIQQNLDEIDALNRFTTAIGSAVFAILPGFREGGWLGESVLG